MNSMIDYIKATTSFRDKGTNIIPHLCNPDAVFSSGWEKYYLEGCEKLVVWVNPSLQLLRLEGSIPYYWQGHNFCFSKGSFLEAINYISSYLNVDIWKAQLQAFEYGVIVESSMKPKDIILHHSAIPHEKLLLNENQKDRGNYRNWKDGNVQLKMYDAGRNIIYKQGLDRRQIIHESGWNDSEEYLKWEIKYLKPEFLNRGVALCLFHLMNKDWINVLKNDVLNQYKRLLPMKSIIIPSDKKDLSTADILALTFAEQSINSGMPLDSLKKMLYSRINSIPDEVLTSADKAARKRQVKILLEKLKESPESQWNLSEHIQKALDSE